MADKKESLEDILAIPPEDQANRVMNSPQTPSILIIIRMQNLTAGTSVAVSNRLKVLQILDKGLVLEAPAKACAVGHQLELEITAKIPEGDLEFKGTARVEKIEQFPDHSEQLRVKLIQYPEAPWEAIHRTMAKRQAEISQFLMKAGGRE